MEENQDQNQEQHEVKRRGRPRGPVVKPDRVEQSSVSPESFGALEDETPNGGAPTPETEIEEHVNSHSFGETPAMAEMRQRMEQKAAAEPAPAPHPYEWRIVSSKIVPFHYRDPSTGEVSEEKIREHIAYCWRIETPPEIPGVLISRKLGGAFKS